MSFFTQNPLTIIGLPHLPTGTSSIMLCQKYQELGLTSSLRYFGLRYFANGSLVRTDSKYSYVLRSVRRCCKYGWGDMATSLRLFGWWSCRFEFQFLSFF